MILRRLTKLVAASLLFAAVDVVSSHAQAGPIVSLAFGSLSGSGGNWRKTGHQTLDIMAGVRTRYELATGLVIGGYAGASNKLFGTEAKNCVTSTGSECLPAFPQFKYLGLAIGGETRNDRFGVVVAGGPGVFTSPRTRIATRVAGGATQFTDQPSSRRFGMMGRADFTFFIDDDFGFLAAVSTRVVPSFADQRLMLTGFSLGIRIK